MGELNNDSWYLESRLASKQFSDRTSVYVQAGGRKLANIIPWITAYTTIPRTNHWLSCEILFVSRAILLSRSHVATITYQVGYAEAILLTIWTWKLVIAITASTSWGNASSGRLCAKDEILLEPTVS